MSIVILRFFQNILKGCETMDMKERIQALCKEKGISVNKLEKDLGFGTGYVSKLGKSTPNTAKIKLIADYFNVSVDYLMTGEENSITDDMVGEHIELISLYENLTQEQKDHVLNMMRLFNNK